jgi:DNA-binding PadR family transcriptional regulator
MTKNDLVVLGLLKEQPMYGYQIKHQIELRKLDQWAQVSLASIYYTLNRLEEKDCISAHHEKVGKMPERIVYRLTPKGEKRLSRLVEKALVSDQIPDTDFAVGIAFMYGLEKEKVEVCLKKKIEILRMRAEYLKEEMAAYQEKIPFNWLYLIHIALEHIGTEIEHLKRLYRTVKKGQSWNSLVMPQTGKRGPQ